MLSTQISVRSSSSTNVHIMEYAFEPNKTTVRDMLRDVRKQLKIQNVSLSSRTATIKTAEEIHYKHVGEGLKDEAIVQLVLPDNTNDTPRLFEIKSQEFLSYGTLPSLFVNMLNTSLNVLNASLNVFYTGKGILLVQKPNIEGVILEQKPNKTAVLLECLQVRIDVNTTTTVAEIKHELLKREKGARLGSDYRLRLRSRDGEQWKEIYERNDTLVVDTSLSGPVIDADLVPVVDIYVSTSTGNPPRTSGSSLATHSLFELQVAPLLHTTYDLKLLIEARKRIPPHEQRLVYAGKQLEDEPKLSYYNIGTKSEVDLVLRLPGGIYHETSSREDFATLAEQKKRLMSVKVLLPGGEQSRIQVSHYDTVDRLRELALAMYAEKSQSQKRASLDVMLEKTEDRIKRLRLELETEERIKRLRCELLDAELEKERLLRSEAASEEDHE